MMWTLWAIVYINNGWHSPDYITLCKSAYYQLAWPSASSPSPSLSLLLLYTSLPHSILANFHGTKMYGPYKGKKMNSAKSHESRGTDAFPIEPTGKNVAIDN